MSKINNYKFEPGAMSIVQMGEELIGHPTTAINELIKNSYDADATECTVYINYNKIASKTFLVVHDTGLGMGQDVLFGEWLQPSVSSKRTGNGKSEIFNRNLLGKKGIGRLATMALGRYITVITKTSEEENYNWVYLDREQFKTEELLNSVFFPGGNINNYIDILHDKEILEKINRKSNKLLLEYIETNINSQFNEGTLIIVENLDDSLVTLLADDHVNLEKTKIEETEIMRSLETLIIPLSLDREIQSNLIERKIISEEYELSKKDSIFTLKYGINLIKSTTGEELFFNVEPNKVFKHYEYRVLGKVTNDGNVIGKYICERLDEDSFEDKLEIEKKYALSDEHLNKRTVEEIEDVPPELINANIGDFYFDIRIYDREKDSIDKLATALKAKKIETRRILNEILGLRISKNGFGVKPYGEENKDWLGLDKMRVQDPAHIISSNQILGHIFLYSPQNDGLSEKTNREGFFENKAFITFKKILRAILIESGKRRYLYRIKHNLGRSIKSKLERPDTKDYLEYIANKTKDSEIVKKSEKFVRDIKTTLDNMEYTLTFSQRLASLGSGLELVFHELSQPISQLGATKDIIEIHTNKIINDKIKKKLEHEVVLLDTSIDTLDELKNSLKPAIGLSRPTKFKPQNTFMKVCFLFTKDISETKIEINADSNMDEYSITDYEYAYWISFLNIVNNAVYWLKLGKIKKKEIYFSLEKGGVLVIGNNGPLIPDDDIEAIFEYGVTLKKEKNATGLGLSFSRSILDSIDCDIWAENRKTGPVFFIKKRIK